MRSLEAVFPENQSFIFGPFRLVPARQSLYANAQRVDINKKAFQILLILVSHAGEIISTDRLNDQLWRNASGEDTNLRVQIAGLRRALGEHGAGVQYVQNVSGRGYRFAGSALYRENYLSLPSDPGLDMTAALQPTVLSPDPLFGRDADIATIGRLLASSPITTVVGAGGVGKTVAAIKAMNAWCTLHSMDAVFVDLSYAERSAHASSALIAALSSLFDVPPSRDRLLHALRTTRLLVVFDSCDTVIDAVADLAEHIAQWSSGTRVLVTCREPLRVRGESIHRLLPLPIPAQLPCAPSEARDYPSVQLLRARANAWGTSLAQDDETTLLLCEICVRLDGLPLAIELAACSLSVFTLRQLGIEVTTPLGALTRGRRTAPIRHQTLRSSIDWSYDRLEPTERQLLRALSRFGGSFGLPQAVAIVTPDGFLAPTDTFTTLLSLVDKSMLMAERGSSAPTFRLLNVMRDYGLEKLREAISLRHQAGAETKRRVAGAAYQHRPCKNAAPQCFRKRGTRHP